MERKRKVLYTIFTFCVVLTSYIWLSGIYYDSEATLMYTTSEVELFNGKYIMSDEYQISDADGSGMDCIASDGADDLICYVEYGEGTRISVYSILEDSVAYQTDVGDWSEFPRTDNGQVVFSDYMYSGGFIPEMYHNYSFVYDYLEDEVVQIPLENAGHPSIWNGTVAMQYIEVISYSQDCEIFIYNIEDDDFVSVVYNSSSDDFQFWYPDINEYWVSCVQISQVPTSPNIDNVLWYNVLTEEVGYTDFHTEGGADIYLSYVRLGGDSVIYTYSTGAHFDLDFSIRGYDLDYEGEGSGEFIIIDESYHDEYYFLDVSNDLVVYDAFDDDIGTWGCYAYDLVEEIEFNVSVDLEGESFYPTVWFNDDGHGIITYTKYNGETGYYDIFMRYINDTTIISAQYDEAQIEPELVAGGEYDLYWIYVSFISTIIAIFILVWDRNDTGNLYEEV